RIEFGHRSLRSVVIQKHRQNPPRNRVRDGTFVDAITRQAHAPEPDAGAILPNAPGLAAAFVAPRAAAVVARAPHADRIAALAALQTEAVFEIRLEDADRQLPQLREHPRRAAHAPDRRAVELGAVGDVHLRDRRAGPIAGQALPFHRARDARFPD